MNGAKTRVGLNTGHIAIGPTNIHGFVSIYGDETYVNTEQEVRGYHSVVRNARTTPDEGTLGWDFFGVMGAVVVTSGNTQYIRGNQKAVVGELYFQAPLTGTYSVKKAHNFQASAADVGSNVTVETYYGLVVNSPTGSGAITEGYGIYIESMSKPSTKAAIKLGGTDLAGRIFWPTGYITEEAAGNLAAVASSISLAGLAGAEAARAVTVASAVNRWEFYGATTGNAAVTRATGSDTNVGATYQTKGTGVHTFQTNLGTTQFQVRHLASAVNWLNARGGTTGNAAEIFADGETDVDILFTPKGVGRVRFGTHSALSGETVTGYITIKDAGGTSRKIAVVS